MEDGSDLLARAAPLGVEVYAKQLPSALRFLYTERRKKGTHTHPSTKERQSGQKGYWALMYYREGAFTGFEERATKRSGVAKSALDVKLSSISTVRGG